MNQNQSRNYVSVIVPLLVVAVFVITGVMEIHAQLTSMFLQTSGQISAVNTIAKSITITYPQALRMSYCITEPCPPQSTGRSPNIVTQDQVLVLNAIGGVVDNITTLKVGDGVIVYLKQNSPYTIKDISLVPPGCDPLTSICVGTGTITPDGVGGQSPSGSGTSGGIGGQPPTTPPGGSGSQPPVRPCVQVQTYPPKTICPANIQSDLNIGVQSSEVLALQVKLQSLGYFPNTIQPTGYFGPVTKQAVIQYQATNSLPQTGYVGPMTRSALGY